MYANSFLVTLNSRNVVRDNANSVNQASYTVPLSRIVRSTNEAGSGHAATTGVQVKIATDNYSCSDAMDLDVSRKRDLDSRC